MSHDTTPRRLERLRLPSSSALEPSNQAPKLPANQPILKKPFTRRRHAFTSHTSANKLHHRIATARYQKPLATESVRIQCFVSCQTKLLAINGGKTRRPNVGARLPGSSRYPGRHPKGSRCVFLPCARSRSFQASSGLQRNQSLT